MRALVIDDNPDSREILGRYLQDLGFEVFRAENGRKALDLLKATGRVDVALVDLYMPEMDGYRFVYAVRAEKVYDDMRLMMVTTETDIGHIVKALQIGANEYLMKPFTKDMVHEKLKIMGILL
ncbi:MAG: response regulator [Elusimicrobia bacterium]|nr:response regulator [Elusimicrobiota bacterium]